MLILLNIQCNNIRTIQLRSRRSNTSFNLHENTIILWSSCFHKDPIVKKLLFINITKIFILDTIHKSTENQGGCQQHLHIDNHIKWNVFYVCLTNIYTTHIYSLCDISKIYAYYPFFSGYVNFFTIINVFRCDDDGWKWYTLLLLEVSKVYKRKANKQQKSRELS